MQPISDNLARIQQMIAEAQASGASDADIHQQISGIIANHQQRIDAYRLAVDLLLLPSQGRA